MSVFKTTFSRTLRVIPSDNCNVPSPHLLTRGLNTTYNVGNPNLLIDDNNKFIKNASSQSTASQGNKQYVVNVGDVVYCYETLLAATVVQVISDTELLLNADIFQGNNNTEYFIYQEGPTTGLGNQGCFIYVGGTTFIGDLHITTIGGDDITISKISSGVLHIQTKKVWGNTNVEQVIALW